MNSNPVLEKEFVRSDQPALEEGKKKGFEVENGGGTGQQRSSSFVAIDLYGQDRTEYLYTSLFTGIIQVPILITIHELLTLRKAVNSYEIAYAIVVLQLLTMILYFWKKNLFFFDVPKEGRVLLILRSIIFAISFTLFVRSMSFLNPVSALMCQQAGVLVSENAIRFLLRQNMVWNVIILKMSITICLLVPGWVPETCPVEPPLIEEKVHPDAALGTSESTETTSHVDPDWMLDYRSHALEAFIAGTLMCIVSRISHILAKPGALRHEAFMSMYAYVFSACVMPIFIFANLRFQNEELRTKHQLADFPTSIRISGFLFLFFLLCIKNWFMERGIMKRFIEDYDPAVHETFPCWGDAVAPVQNDQPLPDPPTETDGTTQSQDEEMNRQVRQQESNTDVRYNSHVQNSRRNTVNLACLSQLMLTCVYLLTYEAGLDLEDNYDQPSLSMLPCIFAIWLITKPLAVFTYYDDLILTY